MPAAELDALIRVNVCGVAHTGFVEAGRGVVVSLVASWQLGPLGVARGRAVLRQQVAIEGMTRALAAELPAGLAATPRCRSCSA